MKRELEKEIFRDITNASISEKKEKITDWKIQSVIFMVYIVTCS